MIKDIRSVIRGVRANRPAPRGSQSHQVAAGACGVIAAARGATQRQQTIAKRRAEIDGHPAKHETRTRQIITVLAAALVLIVRGGLTRGIIPVVPLARMLIPSTALDGPQVPR